MESIESIISDGSEVLAALPKGDPRIRVALLDGPVDVSHPCLEAASIQLSDPFEFARRVGGKATEHGTQIASVIFGQPGTCIEGLAPMCHGISIAIYRDEDSGSIGGTSQLMLASAIEYAIEANAGIINVSGGQITKEPLADGILERYVNRCASNGILIVAAAGNEGCACIRLPAAMGGVLAVGAHDETGAPLESCNFGEPYRTNGLLAPGYLVPMAGEKGGVMKQSGSSFATAVVSGLVARIYAALILNGDSFSPVDVGRILLETADECSPGLDEKGCLPWSGRRLNLRRALERLKLTPSLTSLLILPRREENEMSTLNQIDASSRTLVGDDFSPSMEPNAANGIEETRIKTMMPACEGGCGGGATGPAQLIYALGQLDIDFGTEARRDAFVQHMGAWRQAYLSAKKKPLPSEREYLKAFLDARPEFDEGLTWVLKLDTTPVYAVRPLGTYAQEISKRLREAYISFGWVGEDRVDLISLPGIARGSARLLNGQLVPVLLPDLRGMYDWTIEHLAKSCLVPDTKAAPAGPTHTKDALVDFLNRIYFELRNLGQSGADRALNYSATQAWQVAKVFERAVVEGLVLRDTPSVTKSPLCRPESDCYDVVLTFFDPVNRLTKASRAFRFTVDVSDVLPVMVGEVRSWHVASAGIA